MKKDAGLLSAYKGLKRNSFAEDEEGLVAVCLLSAYKGLKRGSEH